MVPRICRKLRIASGAQPVSGANALAAVQSVSAANALAGAKQSLTIVAPDNGVRPYIAQVLEKVMSIVRPDPVITWSHKLVLMF